MNATYAQIAKMIDHSLLNPACSEVDLQSGIQLARQYDVASVCILPYYLGRCAELLRGIKAAGAAAGEFSRYFACYAAQHRRIIPRLMDAKQCYTEHQFDACYPAHRRSSNVAKPPRRRQNYIVRTNENSMAADGPGIFQHDLAMDVRFGPEINVTRAHSGG